MKKITSFCWIHMALGAVLVLVAVARQLHAGPAERVVSVGGSVTEIVYALGQEHRLVARDTTSNHPPQALDLPDVGYVRRLSPEGLLSVAPDLILTEDGAGPPEALELLRSSAIPVVTIPMGFTRDAVVAKIEAVADALGVPGKGAELAARVGAEIDAAARRGTAGKRVLFIMTMQGGRVLAGGADTAAEGIIALAGAVNAAEGFDGYKLMTDEAVLAAAPDVILVMRNRGDMALSDDDLLAHPALAATPAGQSRAILRMEGMYLLGFSVRTGQAVADLAAGLDRPKG
ncbi:MAG: hemin ABC transporter substrate-binding protein [Jhaorihella sp.]